MGLTWVILGLEPLSAGMLDLRLTGPPRGGPVSGRHSARHGV